jgi:hypothetical protein
LVYVDLDYQASISAQTPIAKFLPGHSGKDALGVLLVVLVGTRQANEMASALQWIMKLLAPWKSLELRMLRGYPNFWATRASGNACQETITLGQWGF